MQPQPIDPALAQGALVGFLVGFVCVAFVGLGIAIWLCYLTSTCYARIPPRYRRMEPGMVWLMLIPGFGLVWSFFVYLRLSASFQDYFESRGRDDVGDCGRTLALVFLISNVAMIPLRFLPPMVALLALPLALVTLITFIIYLVKVVGLRNQIPAAAGKAKRSRRDEDDDDVADEDDDDDDRRPTKSSKKRVPRDDDDDDAPPKSIKKRKYADDDDEEDDAPPRSAKKRRYVDDDDEEDQGRFKGRK